MDVKEAARTAKEYLQELFSSEQIRNVGLEEVEFDRMSHCWKITVGFSRPWDQGNSLIAKLGEQLGEQRPARSYKVIRIDDRDGRVESLTDRFLNASG